MNPKDVKYTTANSAFKAGELWYRKKQTSIQTNEEFEQIRPIFIIDDKERTKVSVPYLYKFFTMSNICVMLRNNASDECIRYIYRDGVYHKASDNDICKILTKYIEDFNINLLNSNDLSHALKLIDLNCDDNHYHDEMNTNEEYINFKNGLLNIRTMELEKHSPDLMSSIQIPCNWLEKEQKTPKFDKFIDSLTDGDEQKKQLILEYIGAVISNVQGWRFKKALFLVGKGNTGKSTLIKLITDLLGQDNISERDLRGLSARFGTTASYNKRLIFSNDLSFIKIEENAIFKNLTGGDMISIEFKNKEPFDYRFKGFLVYGMNDLPHFGGDKGNHVYERIIIIRCDNAVSKSKIDPHLTEKIYAERDGIVRKCVLAMKEAVDRNYQFAIPEDCQNNLTDYKKENSCSVEFWTTYVEKLEDCTKPVLYAQSLYDNFIVWCKKQGLSRVPSFPEFRKEVSSFYGKSWSDMTKRSNKGSILTEHQMTSEWFEEFGNIEVLK